MSQNDGVDHTNPQSSSFPVSSPSFWAEAVRVPTTPPPNKRERSQGSEGSDLVSDRDESDSKRIRRRSPTTRLAYLPNRTGPMDDDDPHSYLTNPEYAPNRFGDIGDYMRKKEVKVQTQNRDIAIASAASGVPQIFAGLSFYINGNTHPPMEELRKMILQRGGETRPVLRSKGMVKFIIAPMLTQSKFKQFEHYRVVREGWITESCQQGKLLDWSKWKLQIIGGWEEGSKKGMEGFLNGQLSSKRTVVKREELEDDSALNAHSTAAAVAPTQNSLSASTQSLLTALRTSIVTPVTQATSDAVRGASAANRNLLQPRSRAALSRSSSPSTVTNELVTKVLSISPVPTIPISPGAVPELVRKESTPAS
ncbi:MAG: deoxycytidyl transferase, partial [Tremellales sp. Tagirdzhanova-0007]